jgi:hypothetical protein
MEDNSNTPAPALANVPETWPGPFGIYKYSKQIVKHNVTPLVIIYLVMAVIDILTQLEFKQVGRLLSYIIDALGTASFTLLFLAGLRGESLSIGETLKRSAPFWLKAVGLQILVAVSYLLSAVLLIVPFLFVFPRLSLAFYFLVDQDMGVIEAYKASWAATKGYALKAWSIFGATFLMGILVLTIIGIPFAIYFVIMYSAAFAVLYKFIQHDSDSAATSSTPQPVAVPPALPPATPPAIA